MEGFPIQAYYKGIVYLSTLDPQREALAPKPQTLEGVELLDVLVLAPSPSDLVMCTLLPRLTLMLSSKT